MYYDALTLAAVRDELSEHLLGGRVQRIVRPSDQALGLEIYTGERHQLLLSADAQRPGVLLLEAKLRRGPLSPSPLQLLLRKFVRGARLEAVQQPAYERVLRLTFVGQHGPVDLICEIMGRLSNIILVSPDGLIMESIKRIPSSINRYRTILPTYPYVGPPPQNKQHPLLLTPAILEQELAKQPDQPVWRRLVGAVFGISPLLAKEIVYRATGAVNPSVLLSSTYADLVMAMADLWHLPETHAWTPCIVYEGKGEDRHPIAYAPYDLTHLADRQPAESISAAISMMMAGQPTYDAYKPVRDRLHRVIDAARSKQKGRLASLQQALDPESEIEIVRFSANTIYAMAWAIKPGQDVLVADPAEWGEDMANLPEGLLHIPLDPLLSPSENAQKLFSKYRKMKAAAVQVPKLVDQTRLELDYLRQLHTEVDLAEDRAQLDEVEHELRAAGYLKQRKKPEHMAKSKPISVHAEDGTLILVGRNSQQNDEVTFRHGASEDIWLHAHGVPGSHVIVKCRVDEVAKDTLDLAARLAAHYSAAAKEARVQVDYTERRHVRRIKGARPGMVTYTHEKTLVVTPDIDDLQGDDGGE